VNKEYVLKWCIKAESDLKAAKELLKSKAPPTDVIYVSTGWSDRMNTLLLC